ncbi:unnamed protein product [Notodromas monacha]|uniref:Lipase domain-containing protein n=1 Tax=Notodromas monacha TaxID=399045 RepID=A0A7R9BN98_9CRUS|nr:unnamed protein product [Notodromas monacha]CAG0918645.1 unnamed protein product [Notodromas monacha]
MRKSAGILAAAILVLAGTLPSNSAVDEYDEGRPSKQAGVLFDFLSRVLGGVALDLLDALAGVRQRNMVDDPETWNAKGVTAILLFAAFGATVCYDMYGCYETGYPWFDPPRRWIELAPRTPSTVGPNFLLYTRRNDFEAQTIWSDYKVVSQSNFQGLLPTKVIVHGQNDAPDAPWLLAMKDAFLDRADVNVIIVDWHPLFIRHQARADARLAGVMTASFLQFLKDNFLLNMDDLHIIGHSLGSHFSSYICYALKGGGPEPVVGRLTALDPSHPAFTDTDPVVRVDPTDAKFVDVIHSDVYDGLEGLGTNQNMGHVDFFPNGGGTPQPGCDMDIFQAWREGNGNLREVLRKYVYCSHFRAVDFFLESIQHDSVIGSGCDFRAVACQDWRSFAGGQCSATCPQDGTASQACMRMGYNSVYDYNPDLHGTGGLRFYLRSDKEYPFCRYQYYVSVRFGSLLKRPANREGPRTQQGSSSAVEHTHQESSRDGRFFLAMTTLRVKGDAYVTFRDSSGVFIENTFKLNGPPLKVEYNTRINGILTSRAPLKTTNTGALDGEIHFIFVPKLDFNTEILVPDITLTSVETSASYKMCSDGMIGGRKWSVIPIVFTPCS